jgi:hypothetical protein
MIKSENYVAKGNLKLPKSTWVLNSGSATECPSMKLGLCQVGSKCYALKPEIQYPAALPYRKAQRRMIKTTSADEFAYGLLAHNERCRNKMDSFRYNEAGDFEDQSMVNWFVDTSKIFDNESIVSYGYTARTDLDLTELIATTGVNVSNDSGGWQDRGANRFKTVKRFSGEADVECGMDCKVCSACSYSRGLLIECEVH